MPEAMRVMVEVGFNLTYLGVVYVLVYLMATRQERVAPSDRPITRRLVWMFALLALGDTGHVGFRVLAYALGGLEANPALVGWGALSTAYTVTLFYMILVDVWRLRFKKPLGVASWLLLAAGAIRLIVMTFPQNEWQQVIAPYSWSLFRNAFLVVQGLGIMFLIFRDSAQARDRVFRAIAWCIAWSYAFYAPVILWAAQVPLLGMLMIPKTCAYVAVAVIAYRSLYKPAAVQAQEAAAL